MTVLFRRVRDEIELKVRNFLVLHEADRPDTSLKTDPNP